MKERTNPLIVALDVSSAEDALRLVSLLAGSAGLFKVGLQLFTAEGPPIVREIQKRGGSVFLDLKLHDIPNTVAQAAVEAGRLGVQMLTLHTLGGGKMLQFTRSRVDEQARKEGWPAPKLLGITILTSMNQAELQSVGIRTPVSRQVLKLGQLAAQSQLDGVVASPHELSTLRTAALDGLIRVIPGVRPAGTDRNDQARAATPFDTIAAGADYLVVGRPITQAQDPAKAAGEILEEIRRAQDQKAEPTRVQVERKTSK